MDPGDQNLKSELGLLLREHRDPRKARGVDILYVDVPLHFSEKFSYIVALAMLPVV